MYFDKTNIMSRSKIILSFLFILTLGKAYSQFTLDAELRPRFEYRHGYKSLFPDHANPAAFISQRTRLNFGFKSEKLQIYVSPQDVRVWGDVQQMNVKDENGLSVYQAWGEVFFTPEIAIKVGRQEIVYDDQRILGNVGWAQQGRSHDAFLLKWEPNNLKLHLGTAYNQDKERITGNILTTNTYKSLQYLWLHKDWKNLAASFLYLNNGLQYIDGSNSSFNETRYSQTAGFHLMTKPGKFQLASNLFHQFGRDLANNDLDAYLLSLEAGYTINTQFGLGLGAEFQSGNDSGFPGNEKNHAFTPLYGTNHKFNGLMDYFYVGNHLNNVGLIDLHGNLKYNFSSKSNLNLAVHQILSAAEMKKEASKNLSFEVDLTASYQLQKHVGLQAGYSHFFASKGIETLQNNFDGNTNNWAWVMMTINPVLLNWQGQ